jgi:hypothetical protein
MGHVSILTTAKYTHLTDTNDHQSYQKIDSLMSGFNITWGNVISSNPGKPYDNVVSSTPVKQVGGVQ